MKHYYPTYYQDFFCIAADCPDSCCQGWDVVIDSDTERFYNTVKGEFGEKLRNAIYTDSDGDRIFRLADQKQCPFWGADRLCDIYRELTEEHLCTTCKQFPRLSMEYAEFTEHSLALACPEAARLILLTDNAYASFTQETSARCEDYDAQDMEMLLQARRKCAEILTSQKPLSERLREFLAYGKEVQNRLQPYEEPNQPFENSALSALFGELEYIDNNNRIIIQKACEHAADFDGQEPALTRLALYYLYRYILNAVGSLDVLAPIKHMAVSAVVISNLARDLDLSLTKAAQLYSKETEQSYENMERLYDAFGYDPAFSTENIINLTS
ncbi:MAG: flagellin lysine-N-methylase [Ruminococcus sp.]|nr:flagellin lysine-N-methylase [Ruminococcus sp.]